ncbi:MAG: 5-(carboxyamino)imidazole ribonucleotide mutase [Alphaproteobacteria bacterium]|nr:5-(carboxyamino)imidazole ribonucleotide mutase [Alphaproteobacteria bacterium]
MEIFDIPAHARVGVIFGSKSDWPTMRCTTKVLDTLKIVYDHRIVSAHRTPDRLSAYAKSATNNGLKVLIAGAGGAAHLPGMVAAMTHLPVLGVPITTQELHGLDSLYSIVQMPAGVPVGCLKIGAAGAHNAALLAASILALSDPALSARLQDYRAKQTQSITQKP